MTPRDESINQLVNGLLKIIRKERTNRNTTLHLQISHVVLYHWGLMNGSS